MTKPPSIEEFAALQKALDAVQSQRDAAQTERDSLAGENRILQRDLLQEKLNKLMRKVFAASSEVLGTNQKDMFFNSRWHLPRPPRRRRRRKKPTLVIAMLPATNAPSAGRKPLDLALPRHVVRHELSDAERVCAHDGATLVEIGAEASERTRHLPLQVRGSATSASSTPVLAVTVARLAGKPPQIIPKGLFTESALAWIATSKFDGAAAVPAGGAARSLWRNGSVAQHDGREHRARGLGQPAGDQPAARPLAGLAHSVWR